MKSPTSSGLPISFVALVAAGFCAASAQGSESVSKFSAGQKVQPFQTKTIDGKTVKFPDDFKGKVVLLDFWATWCGPCRDEIPNVVSAYQKYHQKGFEILGVSLDEARQGPQLIQFTKAHNMTWPQIYDGRYWKAQVAVLYGIDSIPHAFLVDGDTGSVIAEGHATRGNRLALAIEKALAAKTKK